MIRHLPSRSLILMLMPLLTTTNTAPLRAENVDKSEKAEKTEAQGLLGYWQFEQLASEGTVAPDASDHGRDGRLHGQPLVEGLFGRALGMEGYPEQILELGDLNCEGPATVTFWIWTRDISYNRRILSQLEGTPNQAGSLRFDGCQLEVFDGGKWLLLARDGLRLCKWMHVAVVFQADGTATGYIDGQARQTVRSGFHFRGVKAAFGAKFLGREGNVLIGRLDELRIYERALSADQIARLAVLPENHGSR